MAIYLIGDIQGCCNPLDKLLEKIHFDPQVDQLWSAGDLVNRGPCSVEVLRRFAAFGKSATVVLGNHDLHLLAIAYSGRKQGVHDTLDQILQATDREYLLNWLRQQKLAHFDQGVLLVHAGVLPQWDVATTLRLANEVELVLQGTQFQEFLENIYGNHPDQWDESLQGIERLRMITNALTRLRFCTPEGKMEFETKYGAEAAPVGYLPWFDIPQRITRNQRVAFGHWSTLGLRLESNIIALDTGCVWGGKLTAIRLEDNAIFQTQCEAAQMPGSI